MGRRCRPAIFHFAMFNRIKESRQRELMEKIAMIKPTSKSELKQSCLMLSNLDVDKAKKMYDFLVQDMKEIPELPLAQKPLLENIKEQANDIFGWLRENEDMLSKGVEFFRGIITKRKGKTAAAAPLPPINE